jgi:hypothetical protein
MKGDGELSLDEVNTYRQVSLLTRKFSNPPFVLLVCLFCLLLLEIDTSFFFLFLVPWHSRSRQLSRGHH